MKSRRNRTAYHNTRDISLYHSIYVANCGHKIENCVNRLRVNNNSSTRLCKLSFLRVIYVDNAYDNRDFSSFLSFLK